MNSRLLAAGMVVGLSLVLTLASSVPVLASCAQGAAPDCPRSGFDVTVGRFDPATNNRSHKTTYSGTLRVLKKNMSLVPGQYAAQNPERVFERIVSLLKQHDFFAMHLAPTKVAYIDGPDDSIAVSRCGQLVVLGAAFPMSMLSLMREVDLDDPQWALFTRLLDDIQAATLTAPWVPQPTPTGNR